MIPNRIAGSGGRGLGALIRHTLRSSIAFRRGFSGFLDFGQLHHAQALPIGCRLGKLQDGATVGRKEGQICRFLLVAAGHSQTRHDWIPVAHEWADDNKRISTLSDTAVIVLAAGKGTRMKSRRAKVLHELCGVPMLGHVLRNAKALTPSRLIVVIGTDANEVRAKFDDDVEFVLQEEQLGTGHAVLVAEPMLGAVTGDVLVLYGDTPLLRPATIEKMRAVKQESGADLVMLTAIADNIPGRVLRAKDGRVERIIEASDATPAELAIEERNTGVYLFGADLLREGSGGTQARQ